MHWGKVSKGAAVCAAMGAFLPSAYAVVDPGFTVTGVQVSTSPGLGGGASSNNDAQGYGVQYADGGLKTEVTPAQIGVPGKLEVVQYYSNYDRRYDSFTFSVQSTDELFRSGNLVSFSGTVTMEPGSILHGQPLSIHAELWGEYQNAGPGPAQVAGICCTPAAPSYFFKLNGGPWEPLGSSTSFGPVGVSGGDGLFYSYANHVVYSSQFTFELLVYAGAVTNIDSFSLAISSDVLVPTGTSRMVLASQEIPALVPTVDEPANLALVLAGGGIVAGAVRRRVIAQRRHPRNATRGIVRFAQMSE